MAVCNQRICLLIKSSKEYDIFADKLIKNKDMTLFENAYNIERYFEID